MSNHETEGNQSNDIKPVSKDRKSWNRPSFVELSTGMTQGPAPTTEDGFGTGAS